MDILCSDGDGVNCSMSLICSEEDIYSGSHKNIPIQTSGSEMKPHAVCIYTCMFICIHLKNLLWPFRSLA